MFNQHFMGIDRCEFLSASHLVPEDPFVKTIKGFVVRQFDELFQGFLVHNRTLIGKKTCLTEVSSSYKYVNVLIEE